MNKRTVFIFAAGFFVGGYLMNWWHVTNAPTSPTTYWQDTVATSIPEPPVYEGMVYSQPETELGCFEGPIVGQTYDFVPYNGDQLTFQRVYTENEVYWAEYTERFRGNFRGIQRLENGELAYMVEYDGKAMLTNASCYWEKENSMLYPVLPTEPINQWYIKDAVLYGRTSCFAYAPKTWGNYQVLPGGFTVMAGPTRFSTSTSSGLATQFENADYGIAVFYGEETLYTAEIHGGISVGNTLVYICQDVSKARLFIAEYLLQLDQREDLTSARVIEMDSNEILIDSVQNLTD